MDETGRRATQPVDRPGQRRSPGVVGRGMASGQWVSRRERAFWLYETPVYTRRLTAKAAIFLANSRLRRGLSGVRILAVSQSYPSGSALHNESSARATSAERQRKDRVLRALGARQGASQPPRLHDRDAIAHAENLRHLGRDHEDRDAAFGEPSHQLVNLRLGADVHALRGLIEDQDLRMRLEPAREGDLLLVASRQRPHVGVDRSRLDAQVLDVRRARPAAPTRHR